MNNSISPHNPTESEKSLVQLPGVSVTGPDDLRPLTILLEIAAQLLNIRMEFVRALEKPLCQRVLDYIRQKRSGAHVQLEVVQSSGQCFLQTTVQPIQLVAEEVGTQESAVVMERAGPDGAELALSNWYIVSPAGEQLIMRWSEALPTTLHVPTAEELARWGPVLQAKSFREAMATALRRLRSVSHQLDEAREVLRRHDESERSSSSEFHALLSLVASKSRNLISILEPHGAIIWVNPAFQEATGYTLDDVRGRRMDELLFGPATDRQAIWSYRQALQEGKEFLDELMLYRRDGNTFWVECNLIPVFGRTREITCWLSIDVDITKWRQAEEAMREAKKLAEESSRMKSEFLANMSHEIRTPMNAIIGMTELALATPLTDEQREYLTTVQSAAHSLLQLLNDVLDLSKIEAGKMTIDEVDFDLAELIRDTLKALAVKAHQKGLELVAHVPMTLPTAVRGDPVRLRQVLFNLVGNAIKFTEQGEVVVEVEGPDVQTHEGMYHFAVRDTGIGIAEDKLTKIFDAFTQADSSTTRKYGGTGLGLAISANLVRLMGGQIWVESRLGEGSTFHFTIRLAPAAGALPSRPALHLHQLRGKTVLVVDDNATNRRILQEMLQYWGMLPTVAAGPEQASQYVQQAQRSGQSFDFALVDAIMPQEDGLHWIATIRQRCPGTIRKIVVLSSIDRPMDLKNHRDLGVSGFVTKPISAQGLAEVLVAVAESDDKSDQHIEKSIHRQSVPTLPPVTPLRILVVDDHEANRRLAVTVLSRRGHTCEEATDGQEALEKWRKQPFDVVLLDIRMPGLDGFQVTRIIRQEERKSGKHTPIIALTAHALKADQEKCLAAGMDGYLAKPLRPQELVAMVESVAQGSSGLLFPSSAGAAVSQLTQCSPVEEARAGDHTVSSELPEANAPLFDFRKALESMDHDEKLLVQQMQYFLKDGPELLTGIRQAVANRDGKQLQLCAHRLKSLLARYDAQGAVRLATELEGRGQQSQWEGAADDVARLAQLMEPLIEAVREYVAAQRH